MTAVAESPARRKQRWRRWVSLAVWVPPTIASLSLPATAIYIGLWLIPIPNQGDLIARLAGHSSYDTVSEQEELGVIGLIAGATLVLWMLASFAVTRFDRSKERSILMPWIMVFTGPLRWWHGIVSRFATVPLAISGTLLLIVWFISALITTASRDGWGSWLFLAMVLPVMLAIVGLGSGLFSRWGANQYGSYLMAFGSIWMLVLLPVVWLWALAGLALALLPVAPLALTGLTLYGNFGYAEVVASIPLDSVWAPLTIQPYPIVWLTALVLAGLYWLPATVSWLADGDTASRGDARPRTVLLDAMRVVYTFPIGPRYE